MSDIMSIDGVVWEKCLKLQQCVKIGWPINKKICIGVSACIRLVEKSGVITLQVDAAGRRFEFKLSNACYTIYTVAIGKIDICLSVEGPKKLRLQAKACIGYGPISDCWDIWGTDIYWLSAAEFAALDLGVLELSHEQTARMRTREDGAPSVTFEHEFKPLAACDCAD